VKECMSGAVPSIKKRPQSVVLSKHTLSSQVENQDPKRNMYKKGRKALSCLNIRCRHRSKTKIQRETCIRKVAKRYLV